MSSQQCPDDVHSKQPPNAYRRETFYTNWFPDGRVGTDSRSQAELARGYTDYPELAAANSEELLDFDGR